MKKLLEQFFTTKIEVAPKQQPMTNQQRRQQRYGGNYLAIQAMLSATGDEKRDKMTLDNTIRNQKVNKVDDSLTKPKPIKSLQIDLNNNVTYAFQKTASVADLLHPEHQQVRRVLDEESKQQSIIKEGGRKPLRSALKKKKQLEQQLSETTTESGTTSSRKDAVVT